jgi:hypothetical protein
MVDRIDPAGDAARVPAVARLRDSRGRFVAAAGASKRSLKPKRKPKATARAKAARAKRGKAWREGFLATLAETSNVTAACTAAGIDSSDAYKLRRSDSGFRAAWRGALLEGYDNLELETLGRLREGELRSDERKFDIANALRLLKAHAEAVAAERARREDCDEQDLLESLDRKIEAMRRRAAAGVAMLAESDGEPG